MPLTIGTRLGPYEIVAPLGAGGMGEVYKAHDTKLGRDVALKILPEIFAHDSDRIARFRREAHMLASLNHQHIAAIYGLEESGSVPALVLELVEGPTLADRLAGSEDPALPQRDAGTGRVRGRSSAFAEALADRRSLGGGWSDRPIPLDEALSIAKQIAQALEAAHEQGIIHRDLKPANIKLRPDGVVKVLDFGLAKALDQTSGSGLQAAADISASPTITSPAMTRLGVILGTAAYMSPEQARGHAVDKSADIWAFGCVLFEMRSGTRTFPGVDATDTIAAIIRAEPDWSLLPADTPPSVLRVLRRCLEKDRRRRLADIRDARLDLEDPRSVQTTIVPPPASTRRRERLMWAAALTLAVVAAAMLSRGNSRSPVAPPPEMRVEITTPPTTDQVSLALSPDGEKLVFVASSEGRPKLWLRSLVAGTARPLAGTDGASFPFWSPDSRSIGFFANDRVNRIDIDGGSSKALGFAPVGAGGSWSGDDVILFPPVPDAPLMSVPASGGDMTPIPGSPPGEGGHRFPQFLPDGRHFLYYVADRPARGVYIGALDGSGRRRLIDADAAAVFVPPAQLLFLRAGTLFAQRFDLVKPGLEGSPVPLAENIAVDAYGAGAISASAVGSIVYRTGSGSRQRQLAWFDRSGTMIGTAYAPDSTSPLNPALSPDGRLVAINRSVGGNADIWLFDLARSVFSRFTFDPLPEIYPVWSPDGRRLVYARASAQGFQLYEQPFSAVGDAVRRQQISGNTIPTDWSRDGRFISYTAQEERFGGWDVWALPNEGNAKPFPVAQTTFDERNGEFSSDSKWIAFESNESGRFEIYVQPFPKPGVRTIVSTGGGLQPRWRPDGKELFYVAPDGRLMAVPLRFSADGQSVEPASPVPLFLTRVTSTRTGGSKQEYAVSSDGQRFLMNTLTEQAGAPITLILNRAPF
jgi:eukaryotic-like serine/threonine-protein kinase